MPFPIFKTITVGTYKDVEELKKAITDAGFCIGDWAEDVLNSSQFALSDEEQKPNLVRVTPRDLGFRNGAYRTDIYDAATKHGLQVCPLEVGPQLRLQYPNQPKLESLQIAMESQIDSEGHKSQFRVVHGGDGFLWLVGDHKHPTDFWDADEYFIFII